ncbi:MAG: hypothetical protein ACJ735_02860 [Actinomycetes bacterium]
MSPRRTLWTDLRAIDHAIVSRIARVVGHVRHGLRDARAIVSGAGGPGPTLRRLDQRFARRGVLGLVRDVPQAGAVALTLLLTVAAVTTAARIGGPSTDTAAPDLPAVTSSISTVGPLPNEEIASYLNAAQAALGQQSSQAPGEKVYAIADFESGKTPAQVAAALPGVEPQLIYVQVRASGARAVFPNTTEELAGYATLTAPLRVSSLPGDASAAFRRLADGLSQAAHDLSQQAASITADQDQAQKATEEADARHYRSEAQSLRGECACIYAVVVYGSARTLLDIVDSGKVRVIDPASPGLKLREIRWTPLLPQTSRRQPSGTLTAGP